MPLSHKPWPVSPRKNWLRRLCSPSLGINWMSKWVFLSSDFGSESSSEIRKSTRRFARANSWYAFLWPWNCCISHWTQRPQHHWRQIYAYCRCIQDTKKRQLVTRSNLQRLRCCVCHFHHEQALRAPYRVWHFFAKILKKVRHYRVDVVAGDATAAAYRYQQRQEYQYLCNFWVAVILREMQREANMNRPFQSRRHCDYSTNNKHSQLRSTDYPDCCFMAYSPMEKTVWTQNCEKLWSNTCERTRSEQKEQAEDSSYPEGIEVLLMEAAGKNYPDPENPDNPMIAPRDYGDRTWSTQGHGTNDFHLNLV